MEAAGRGDAAFQVPRWLHANSRCGRKRKRTVFTKEQVDLLVSAFERQRYPSFDMREMLARRIGAHESRVQVWFQNRRARYPMKKKARATSENRRWSQPSTPHTVTPHLGSWSEGVQGAPPGNPSLGGHFYGQPSLCRASCFHGTLLPSPYMGFSPPPPPPPSLSVASIPSQAFPTIGNSPPPGSPYTPQTLPQRTVPPFLCGHPVQGLQQDTSLPQLTEEDLTILHLPAGGDSM